MPLIEKSDKMIHNRSVDITFTKEDQHVLDGQSKICNWLYNQLLDLCIKDYKDNNNDNKYLSGRNLRDQVPLYKSNNLFLKTVHSSPLKNTAIRLKESYKRFFSKNSGYPKFRPWKKKWFSLLYDEPNKGFKINGREIEISLGKNELNKHLHITGTLNESLKINGGEKISTFRLCKRQNTFYGVFTIEKEDIKIPRAKPKKWISIDPNHKNFFVGVDNDGVSVEFDKLKLIKYWDKVIDDLKSQRDACKRKTRRKGTPNGKFYYVPSERWVRINRALERAYNCRREQIKQACYTIAHLLAKEYEKVVIGDYVPSVDTAICDSMHRSMLNEEVIGTFRKTVEWVCYRSKRQYKAQDEKHTTSDCCICEDREHKDPSVRAFICKKCGRKLSRDINSCVNIARKAKLLSSSDYVGWNLYRPTYTVYWNPMLCRVRVTGTLSQKENVDELNQTDSSVWAKLI
jgi:putative transposase